MNLPLPEPGEQVLEPNGDQTDLYTADQMREYAAAAYRAGQEEMREGAAKHLIDLAQDADMEWSLAAKDCADRIRALPIDAD